MNDVICELCGRKFSQITATHLKKEHNITFLEYKKMFPDSATLGDESRQKISDSAVKMNSEGKIGFKKGHTINKDKEPWNKNKTGLQTAWNKGKTKEDDPMLRKSSEKISATIKRKYEGGEIKKLYGKDNPAFGGQLSWNKGKTKESCPSLKRVSEKVSAKRKLMFANGELKRFCGEENPMYGKTLTEKHRKALWSGRKNSHTKPELKMADLLKPYSEWEFVGDGQFHLKTSKKWRIPDFVNKSKKRIIEVYGDYWHRGENPNDKISEYKEIGWDCIVVWESEIMAEDFSVERIKYFL